MLNRTLTEILVLLLSLPIVLGVQVAVAATSYSEPPKKILDVLRAPSPPMPIVSPTRDKILLVGMHDYPSIKRVAQPFLRLAGVRVEPKNHSKHDTPGGYGIPDCARQFDLVNVADGSVKSVAMGKLTCADRPAWSADGRHFAFSNCTATSVELWIGDAQTGRITRVPNVQLNPMFGYEAQWMPNQKSLLVKLVPKALGLVPKAPEVPAGPNIQEANGERGQSSTYEKRDTLTSPHDEALFDYYGRAQLAVVEIENGAVTPIGSPATYDSVLPAPDGVHLLVSSITKPYSYITTYERFPLNVEVWDISKPSRPAVTPIATLPLADRVPVHGVRSGPRDFAWRPTERATLIWAEALDGGDWNVKVPHRDKVMTSSAPFRAAPVELFRLEQRFEGFDWFEQRDMALVTQYDENRHWLKAEMVNLEDAQQKPRVLFDRSSDEKYLDPGHPVSRILANGFPVIRVDQGSMYLAGRGYSPDGDRPFLDRLELASFKTERMFRSEKTEFEQFLQFNSIHGGDQFFTWHQSPDHVPTAFVRTVGQSVSAPPGEAVFASTRKPLTHIPDPTPEVRQIKKRLVKYKRADGLELSFTLFTPPGYQEGTRVPTILYAYPMDFADASKAGQVSGSQYTYTRLRNYKLLLLAGYAIIDQASFPIVGDPKRAYDTYLEQLVADAKAAVNEAVRLGVADPDRIGITGHSHGALMTANLLAHSDLFRAGIATSGSYNKTITPFGFQSERRSIWQAQEVYLKASPYFSVDKIKSPLLIVHGEDDANPGTTPMQAQFLFDAIRGNGGVARLVMLPHEPHWYTALESNEQLVYEMLTWFDRYVKNAGPRK